MSEKAYRDFVKQMLDGQREHLKTASFFECASCNMMKPRAEAAGAHHYVTDDPMLQKAMIDPSSKMPKVCTYVLCLECVDSLPDAEIQKRVTKTVAKQGLFDVPVK